MARTRPWLAALTAVALVASVGCDTRPLRVHVLNRLGFGPDAWTLHRITQLGIRDYIEEQLYPESIDDSALESNLAARYPTLAMSYRNLAVVYHIYSAPNGGPGQVRNELAEAKLLRAYRSRRQLQQVLEDFWFNHFNVDSTFDVARWATTPYLRDAIRPHVLGRFEDLLLATARHPAMLNYLNNDVNFIDGFYYRGAKRGRNENYAREILELHTVGVDAPYTLHDIQEVARAFTGWTVVLLQDLAMNEDPFVYLDEGHDQGAKTIHVGSETLQIAPGGGEQDGVAVVRWLARHPLTAARISRRLCERFVSEPCPETLADRARDVYLATDGDLREVMRTLLTSGEFIAARDAKIKRPVAFVASLARAVGVADEAEWASWARQEIAAMGEDAYTADPPTGYPESSSEWVSSGTMLRRINYAYRAAYAERGFAPLLETPWSTPDQAAVDLATRLLGRLPSQATRESVTAVFATQGKASAFPQAAATLLASPDFVTQ